MTAIERFYHFIEYKGLKPTPVEKELGFSNGYLGKMRTRNASMGSDVLEKIVSYFSDLNTEWLITGRGEMIKSKTQPIYQSKTIELMHEEQDIPIYDLNAAAGLKSLFENGKQNIIDTLRIPNLSKVDGAIFVTGDSMYPLLKSGDIVIFKEINNIDYLLMGNIYILSYEIDGDEYLVVKYINKSERDGFVKLVSYNEHYNSLDIPVSSITSIALVKANIRYNTMQ